MHFIQELATYSIWNECVPFCSKKQYIIVTWCPISSTIYPVAWANSSKVHYPPNFQGQKRQRKSGRPWKRKYPLCCISNVRGGGGGGGRRQKSLCYQRGSAARTHIRPKISKKCQSNHFLFLKYSIKIDLKKAVYQWHFYFFSIQNPFII